MVAKCANPGCEAPFRYFHTGKLFRLDKQCGYERRHLLGDELDMKKPIRHIEFFWLCDECARNMTLTFDRVSGVSVRHHLAAGAAA
ncbi:MAG TPA: hypothetical protein VF133_15260 [Terriglobales bacterium]